jgi:hypothetical protein
LRRLPEGSVRLYIFVGEDQVNYFSVEPLVGYRDSLEEKQQREQ